MQDFESSQVHNSDVIAIVRPGQSASQSIISRRERLDGITLWLRVNPFSLPADNPEDSTLFLALYDSQESTEPLYSYSTPVLSIISDQPYKIALPPQSSLPNQEYFIVIKTNSGEVQVMGRAEDAYPFGQAYIDHTPVEADFAFELTYDYGMHSLFIDLAKWLRYIWVIFPLTFALVLPGWFFLDQSNLRNSHSIIEQVAISIGISLAIIPLLMLWTTRLRITLSATYIWVFIIVLLSISFIKYLRITMIYFRNNRTTRELSGKHILTKFISPKPIIVFSLFFSIFLFSLIIRLVMVRDLVTPAWVDSVHHVFISGKIVEQGGYPRNYLPFIDMNPGSYHPGFHSVIAVLHWLTDFDITLLLLYSGQLLNACIVFSVFLLATSLASDVKIGLVAAFLTGFMTPMPAYYTSWGRYTQLAGLLILPAFYSMYTGYVKADNRNRAKYLILCSIAFAGLLLVHYRVAFFLLALLLADLIANFPTHRNEVSNYLFGRLRGLILLGVITALITLPWLIPTIRQVILPQVSQSTGSNPGWFSDFSWEYLTSVFGKQVLAIALLGLAWGTINKRRPVFLLFIWTGLLIISANLNALNIPGGGFFNNTSVIIMLFMPLNILAGYFLSNLYHKWELALPPRLFRITTGITLGLCLIIATAGAIKIITIINPVTILSRRADIPAIQWAAENLPPDETLLINPFMWGYGMYAGSDGGYWLTPAAGIRTMPPPVLYGVGSLDDFHRVLNVSDLVIKYANQPEYLWSYLKTYSIKYIFLGAKGGIISPKKLLDSGLFERVYSIDGVSILKIIP